MYVLGGNNNDGSYQRQVDISFFDQQVDISKEFKRNRAPREKIDNVYSIMVSIRNG